MRALSPAAAVLEKGVTEMKPSGLLLEAHHHREPAKLWSGERLYFQGDDYFRDLLKSIRRSRRTLDFETYIFEKGRLGDLILSALAKAAARGVKVRLLVDGAGSPEFPLHYGRLLEQGGIEYRVYRSWPVFLDSASRALWFRGLRDFFRHLRRLWSWGTRRDHRKLCIVDGTEAWVGSFNVSDRHLEGLHSGMAWRDTGIVLTGVQSLVFQLAFQLAWEEQVFSSRRSAYKKMLGRWLAHDVLESPVRLNATRRLRRLFNRRLSLRLRNARRRVWITTPYFIPTRSLFRALLKAARKGCDVRLVLPGPSDVPMVKWASMAFYPRLLRAGCRIFEYQTRILHAKTLLVDDRAYVGSSNLNHRSLLHDLEVIVLPRTRASRKALERRFEADLRCCREVRQAELNRRTLGGRILSAVFFQFRYWF